MENYYAVLGIDSPNEPDRRVEETEFQETLKSAYHQRLDIVDPRKFHGSRTDLAVEAQQNLHDAYAVLRDPVSRNRYEREYARYKDAEYARKQKLKRIRRFQKLVGSFMLTVFVLWVMSGGWATAVALWELLTRP